MSPFVFAMSPFVFLSPFVFYAMSPFVFCPPLFFRRVAERMPRPTLLWAEALDVISAGQCIGQNGGKQSLNFLCDPGGCEATRWCSKIKSCGAALERLTERGEGGFAGRQFLRVECRDASRIEVR